MTTLVSALIDIAVRIGKVIVRRLAKWTLTRLTKWMRGRVRVFQGRLLMAKTDRRRAWLAGRIHRWLDAIFWLERNAIEALGKAAKKACSLAAFRKLPEVAKCEKFVGERRAA
jgi:hypothetical protein